MGDANKGKMLFMKICAMCHTTEKDGRHKIGPNLHGIIGRKCGTGAGFPYTEAMKTKGITWDESNLDEYLEVPKKFIPGTKMVYAGTKKAEDRRDIIAFLTTLK